MKKTFVPILIMDDGETWSAPDGASICVISMEEYEDLCDDRIDTGDLNPIFELGLRDYTLESK